MVQAGDVAPAFKVKNHKGQDVELSQAQGQDGRALVLSECRHPWLNQGRLRIP